MVATLAQMASAAYYLESQRSFRHPNEYYTAGEEPDGVWWNPCGLFGLADGGRVDGGEFHRLYHGFAPDGGERLTRNAGSEKRSPGLDMTFSADKSVSALWAIADPELRSEIERAHNDAARAALAGTVLRYCAWTRLQERDGTRVVAADIMGRCSSMAPAARTTRSFIPIARSSMPHERTGTADTGRCTSTRSMPG